MASGVPSVWSAGMGWAIVMLCLIGGECLVLLEIVLSDREKTGLESGSSLVNLYFGLVATTFAMQLSGILLVVKGYYRWGALLQIAASSVHLLKVEGLIGITGGVKAWKLRFAGADAVRDPVLSS